MIIAALSIVVKIGNNPNTHKVMYSEINVLYPYSGMLLCHREMKYWIVVLDERTLKTLC